MATTKAPKMPKKPRQGAPLSAWERYEEKMREREKKIKELEAAKKKKEAIIKKYK